MLSSLFASIDFIVANNQMLVFQVKYDKLHQALYEKRKLVVNAEYEPNEEECDFPSDDEEDEKDLCKDMEDKAKIDGKGNADEKDDTK